MDKDQTKELLKRYNAGQCTEEEKAIVESWYNQLEFVAETPGAKQVQAAKAQVWSSLTATTGRPEQPGHIRFLWPLRIAAASIILLLLTGGYFLLSKKPASPTIPTQTADIGPGGNKAILTLPGGKKIVLTDARNGALAEKSPASVEIEKVDSGLLEYHTREKQPNTASVNMPLVYDTLAIPRGGQYRLKLADGTIVYLNAETKLRYPESFSGKERSIELLNGEAYFEVAHNINQPFTVLVKGQRVEVLGTHFNINAYDDEPAITTTLLQGSVRISTKDGTSMLKPGQQAMVNSGKSSLLIKDADTEGAIAWKEGHFHFDGDDIKTVMRQLARWYDVEVEYNGTLPARKFNGDIDRNSSAAVALQVLSFSKVHFKIEGRKIIVTP